AIDLPGYGGWALGVRPVRGPYDLGQRQLGRVEPGGDRGSDDLRGDQRVVGPGEDKYGPGELAGPVASRVAVVPHVRRCAYRIGTGIRGCRGDPLELGFRGRRRGLTTDIQKA